MAKNLKAGALFILFIITAAATISAASAQAGNAQLRLTGLETDGFPDISFLLAATDADKNALEDLSGLQLTEDGLPVSDFSSERVRVGLELVFVVDANTTIESRDEAGGPSRREKVKDSIIEFANHYMDPLQGDRVSIIVPDGLAGRFVDKAGLTFPNEVINAINFYEVGDLADTPLQIMIRLALKQAAQGREEGRYPTVFLYSDAAQLAEQLIFSDLVENALESETTIFGAILGSRADAEEIENISRLTEPTGGEFVHMPEADRTTPLFEAIQTHGFSHQIAYRSALNESGEHILSVELGNVATEQIFELIIEPASVFLAVDSSQSIRRVAPEADTPLDQIQPTQQPLVAQVGWPDERPRLLASIELVVNGVNWPVEAPVLSDDGLLTFDWDITVLEAGTYDLQVRIVDELNLVSLSEPLPLVIEVERPSQLIVETQPEPTTEPEIASEPTPQPQLQPRAESSNTTLYVGIALSLIFFAIVLSALFGYFWRRRSRMEQVAPAALPAPSSPLGYPAPATDPEHTYIIQPGFVESQGVGAYLESVENAPEHPGLIPIKGSNVALGRDPRRVQVPFKDRSVSRLHARIMISHGAYLLYDEGSSSGTYVNYERVGLSPHKLQDKDDIHFGRVRLRFHLGDSLKREGRLRL